MREHDSDLYSAESLPLPADHRLSKTRITIIGLAINLPLGIGKIIVGWLAQSQSLIADGVHSMSDLVGDVAVITAVHHGGRAPDSDHPYGHGRFETLATVAVAVLLLAAGVGIAIDAVSRLFQPERLGNPGWLALVVGVSSLIVKEGLYWSTIRVARRTRSALVAANAWHHRSDALSSGVAVLGIAGSMAGLVYLDAVAAVVIAGMLVHVAYRHGWDAVRELADTGLDRAGREEIRREVLEVPGVIDMRNLRARQLGPSVVADVGVLVDPIITVTEAHRISEAVRARLIKRVDALTEIVVHVEPFGHEDSPAALSLPLRAEIRGRLMAAWMDIPETTAISDMRLDYRGDNVEVEVILPLDAVGSLHHARELKAQLQNRAGAIDTVGAVKVFLRL